MRGIKNKDSGKWKKIAIFLGLLIVLGFLLNSVGKVYRKKENAEEVLARMQKEQFELQERSRELEETLSRLETEEGLEYEIRKRFNVAGAGESVAIIVEEEAATSSPKTEKSFWQKIKGFFFGF